ncbi:2-amino-4-hydroxy-6-hydroxymethyldihydropteridine diphosphokinase [Psychromonas algicola]|uniref:2-amino-4-hydroxy-6- hydroxymethyldihydropteridine diphosphokinase n=1 Tax=Psychromonas algicola TaxID=2555642 RepID=UPI0010682089|nr:2-amino-4-hydroxy-6-hydroxymethyldihydropteridine diphosphokinase [Psychromonas sp. RZ5]TEW52733.1 2-amino-4-hydroxy-6-hydroxymethyldihydropteridine diphosphokinase [Psychromonas sp. RZ5]
MATIFIGIGSSIDRENYIQQGISLLQKHFGEVKLSSVFESEAVGFTGGNFYNLVAQLTSELPVEQVIAKLKMLEVQLGRPEKAIKFAPRTLDLDILLYDQLVDISLNIPRSEITENAFVLQPLAELAPELLHPLLNESYENLWSQYPVNKQKLWKIEMSFQRDSV